MPELPEVEVVRLGLEPLLSGRVMIDVHCRREGLRYPFPVGFAECLQGRKVVRLHRRAKFLQLYLDDNYVLVWHLGMTGQFHVLPKDDAMGAHEHIQINLDDGSSLRYRDARRFGFVDRLQANKLETHAWFNHLGPEPLTDEFDAKYLKQQCQGKKSPIKTVIMDGKVVVGVGNIYASESLYRAGIHPTRAAGRISLKRFELLVQVIKQVLAEAIAAGGSSISDFVQVDGKPGYFSHSFHVYGRENESCTHCGTK
ncbi:MAG: bifunctional DNA-formamidopyrimidine glycosylase/DNA-(apurinic or apyrimidinic site) lyase, partial [Mariprofundaceae bacterium]